MCNIKLSMWTFTCMQYTGFCLCLFCWILNCLFYFFISMLICAYNTSNPVWLHYVNWCSETAEIVFLCFLFFNEIWHIWSVIIFLCFLRGNVNSKNYCKWEWKIDTNLRLLGFLTQQCQDILSIFPFSFFEELLQHSSDFPLRNKMGWFQQRLLEVTVWHYCILEWYAYGKGNV